MTLNRFGGIGTGRRSWAAPADRSRTIPAMMASGRRATDTRSRVVAPHWGLDDVAEWRPVYRRGRVALAGRLLSGMKETLCFMLESVSDCPIAAGTRAFRKLK